MGVKSENQKEGIELHKKINHDANSLVSESSSYYKGVRETTIGKVERIDYKYHLYDMMNKFDYYDWYKDFGYYSTSKSYNYKEYYNKEYDAKVGYTITSNDEIIPNYEKSSYVESQNKTKTVRFLYKNVLQEKIEETSKLEKKFRKKFDLVDCFFYHNNVDIKNKKPIIAIIKSVIFPLFITLFALLCFSLVFNIFDYHNFSLNDFFFFNLIYLIVNKFSNIPLFIPLIISGIITISLILIYNSLGNKDYIFYLKYEYLNVAINVFVLIIIFVPFFPIDNIVFIFAIINLCLLFLRIFISFSFLYLIIKRYRKIRKYNIDEKSKEITKELIKIHFNSALNDFNLFVTNAFFNNKIDYVEVNNCFDDMIERMKKYFISIVSNPNSSASDFNSAKEALDNIDGIKSEIIKDLIEAVEIQINNLNNSHETINLYKQKLLEINNFLSK